MRRRIDAEMNEECRSRSSLRCLRALGLWAAVGCAVPALVPAQEAAPLEARARRERDTSSEIWTAGEEAALFRLASGAGRVRYVDVLADPDDVALNVRYALQQVRDGNLKGASSTLERVLLLHSDLPRMRLLYAVVLFRLGNIDEAEREFGRLRRYPLAPALAHEIATYERQIARLRKRTRATAMVNVGLRYDSNRNAAPRSDSVLFRDQIIPLTEASRVEDDLGMSTGLSLGFERDLASQEGRKLIGALQLYDSKQSELDGFELQALATELGVELPGGRWTLRPSLLAAQLRLDGETYIESSGLRLDARRALAPKLGLRAAVAFEYQDYKPLDTTRVAPERSGGQLRGRLGLDFAPAPAHRLGLDLALRHKEAREDHHGYRAAELALAYTHLMRGGRFVQLRGGAGHDRYHAAQEFVSSRRRRDTLLRIQSVVGVPLNTLLVGGVVAPGSYWRDTTQRTLITLRLEYDRSFSSLRNYDHQNLSIGLLLSTRWGS